MAPALVQSPDAMPLTTLACALLLQMDAPKVNCCMTTAKNTYCKISATATFEGHHVCHKHHSVLQKTGVVTCTICQDHIVDPNCTEVIRLAGCGHVFHMSCIAEWEGGCPNCRHPLNAVEVMVIQKQALHAKLRDVNMFAGQDAAIIMRMLRQVVELCTTGSYESVHRVMGILEHAQGIADKRIMQQALRYFAEDVYDGLEQQMLVDEAHREADSVSMSADVSVAVVPGLSELQSVGGGLPDVLPGVPGMLGPVFDLMAVPPMPADYTPTASPRNVYASMLVPANVAPIRVRVQPLMEMGVPVVSLPPGMSVAE